MKTENKRNHALDLWKGISCIAVVLFHVSFPGTVGTVINTMTRFAVPFFFMVSGCYSYHPAGYNAESNKKHILHMLKIILAAIIVYVPASFLFMAWGDTVNSSMRDVGTLSWSGVLTFLLLNQPIVIVGQLWFLFALLYDYILYDALEKRVDVRKLYPCIPILLLLYVILAQGLHKIGGVEIPNCWYRNFLVEGFAFFLLGHCIRAGEDRLRIRNGLSVAVIAVFTLGCVAERRLMGRSFGVNICTIPQVAAIFLLCLKKPETGSRSLPGRILCAIGRHISLYVYVIHPFIWRFVNWLYKLGLQNAWRYMGWLKPILVLALTVAVSLVVYGVRSALSKRKPGAAA